MFGGTVKKPLMTKVSMRHLNEIIRERNQYSRDATEAWQDFINLKGKLDTELSKTTKRNNFLVEELESWKQQVLDPNPPCFFGNLTRCSSSNSSRLSTSLPRKHKISKLRLRLTSGRIAVLHYSSISKKTMPHA